MDKGRFVKNAAILTVTSLILRAVGMVFRVYLSGVLGAEGMGLYQLIFSVYVFVATFATGGITVAVTKLAAESTGGRRELGRIMRLAVIGVSICSVVTAGGIIVFADFIALRFIGDIRAAASLRILSLSLPFMGISSCIKGYFLARRNATQPSVSQLLEQAVRIAVIMALFARSAGWGLERCSAAVLIGDTVAEAASCLYSYIVYRRDMSRLSHQNAAVVRGLGRQMLAVAVPITAGRYLTSGLRTVESLFVPERLCRYGMSRQDAVAGFGMLKGMALPVLFFPSSFLTALSTLLVPELSSAAAAGNKGAVARSASRSVEITLVTSVAVAGVFYVCSGQLGRLLYGSDEVGRYICVLAPLTPLMYLESVADGMLKGLGQQNHSLLYNVIDSAVRIAMVTFIVPRFGMNGFLAVMVVSNMLTPILSLWRLLRVSGVRLQAIKWLIRPAVCVGIAAIAAGRLGGLISDDLPSAVLSGGLLLAVYGGTMWLCGGLDSLKKCV